MSKETKLPSNEFNERALWLRAATDALREHFALSDLPLPAKIRFGFSTKGKGTQKTSEAWHSEASSDSSYEVFIRADQDDPVAILGFLVRELTHIALPVSDSHGLKYKAAAAKVGLVGKMRTAVPGRLLHSRLQTLADGLGPLPHRSLDISGRRSFGRRKTAPGCSRPSVREVETRLRPDRRVPIYRTSDGEVGKRLWCGMSSSWRHEGGISVS